MRVKPMMNPMTSLRAWTRVALVYVMPRRIAQPYTQRQMRSLCGCSGRCRCCGCGWRGELGNLCLRIRDEFLGFGLCFRNQLRGDELGFGENLLDFCLDLAFFRFCFGDELFRVCFNC